MALSVLAHPNVVPITDFGVDHGVAFLVMELLEGQTLGDLIKQGPLPLWRALEIARQTLRVLAFSHLKGVVYRDLKPNNVFLQALPDSVDHPASPVVAEGASRVAESTFPPLCTSAGGGEMNRPTAPTSIDSGDVHIPRGLLRCSPPRHARC